MYGTRHGRRAPCSPPVTLDERACSRAPRLRSASQQRRAGAVRWSEPRRTVPRRCYVRPVVFAARASDALVPCGPLRRLLRLVSGSVIFFFKPNCIGSPVYIVLPMPAKLVARFFLLAVHRDLWPEPVRCPDRLTRVRFDCRCVCVCVHVWRPVWGRMSLGCSCVIRAASRPNLLAEGSSPVLSSGAEAAHGLFGVARMSVRVSLAARRSARNLGPAGAAGGQQRGPAKLGRRRRARRLRRGADPSPSS